MSNEKIVGWFISLLSRFQLPLLNADPPLTICSSDAIIRGSRATLAQWQSIRFVSERFWVQVPKVAQHDAHVELLTWASDLFGVADRFSR